MNTPFDRAKASVTIPTDTATAFRMFTEETGLWWRKGVRFRVAGRYPGEVVFEARPGGRLLESFETPQGTRVVELGQITTWEPPHRFCFEWRGASFAPHEKTHVEVLFEAVGSGTFVTVVHTGWANLRADHPVRHGADGTTFIRTTAMWWGDQLAALREHYAKKAAPGFLGAAFFQ